MDPTLTAAAARLYAYITEGLLGDIVMARESYSLLRKMGEHSSTLLATTYGNFFDALDRALLNNYILAIARMFDESSNRYEIRSIPTALGLMRREAKEFPILERYSLEVRL